MPLYEYECQQCHRRTEKRQKFSDPEITECPHCGGPLERVISAPAIAFKGGGWYADGYGNAKPKSAGGEGKGGEAKGSDAPAAAAGAKSEGNSATSSSGEAGSTASPAAASQPAASPAPAPASPSRNAGK